jgi:hypothetical protein
MCERDPLMGHVLTRALLVVLADRVDTTHRNLSPAASAISGTGLNRVRVPSPPRATSASR